MPLLQRLALFLLVLWNVVLPAFFLSVVWHPSDGWWGWPVQLAGAGSYILARCVAGTWDIIGYYWRYVWCALLITGAYTGFQSWRAALTSGGAAGEGGWTDTFLQALVLVLFAVLALVSGRQIVLALAGRLAPEGAVDLHFPLRSGVYYVAQGGSHPLLNQHASHPRQRYALDVVRLYPWGTRAKGAWPQDLSRFAVFGDTVYSPCSGQVIAARDDLTDLVPPRTDVEHPEGNFLAIRCKDVTVYLAHLQRGSLTVRVGDEVAAGQPVARVGNSGNTTEPHLHIHAERGGRGIPMRFRGRFLVRNALVLGRYPASRGSRPPVGSTT